jgi:hypothetical protein
MAAKSGSPVSQTGPSDFSGFRTEVGFKDYRARNDSNASLVSCRPHIELEEEDPVDEGAEDEGRCDREGEG